MIREIEAKTLSGAVRALCMEANTILPQDLRRAICSARDTEPSPVGRAILGDLVENYEFAESRGLPICQDTGMAVVFLDWGQDCHLTGGSLEDAVNEGVRRGYLDGHLRLSVVGDPLRRANTNDNTPAILHLRMVPGDKVDTPIWGEYEKLVKAADARGPEAIGHIERFAFYEEAAKAYAIVATGEGALYANVMLQKGVV